MRSVVVLWSQHRLLQDMDTAAMVEDMDTIIIMVVGCITTELHIITTPRTITITIDIIMGVSIETATIIMVVVDSMVVDIIVDTRGVLTEDITEATDGDMSEVIAAIDTIEVIDITVGALIEAAVTAEGEALGVEVEVAAAAKQNFRKEYYEK